MKVRERIQPALGLAYLLTYTFYAFAQSVCNSNSMSSRVELLDVESNLNTVHLTSHLLLSLSLLSEWSKRDTETVSCPYNTTLEVGFHCQPPIPRFIFPHNTPCHATILTFIFFPTKNL